MKQIFTLVLAVICAFAPVFGQNAIKLNITHKLGNNAFAVNQAILLFYDQWFIFQAILPFIVIGIVLKEIEKMN